MNILVVGGGGREHALVMKISESSKADKIYCVPGNGGIAQYAECFPDIKATDIYSVVKLAEQVKADLVVVAPDDPLVLGMVDALNAKGFKTFGPDKAAAIIEGSKVFSKELMKNIIFLLQNMKYSAMLKRQLNISEMKILSRLL